MNTSESIKCLIVDDIPQNLVALEALLQRDGVDFLKAHSGFEALELLLLHSDVALALLDVQMPEMNGFELAELIRGNERTRHIPLIFMTAGAREPNWQFKGYESGAVDFLFKPVDPDILVTKANVFFELHRRKQQLAWQLQERTEALRINEMFMAVLSHDLRTPLQVINTISTLLKRQPDTPKTLDFAERLLQSSQQMSRMIEDLLDVTRIRQAGGLRLMPDAIDLHALCERSVRDLQNRFPERVVEYRRQGDDGQGSWDGERLAQVLNNVLVNAAQHGDAGQPVRVTLDGTHGAFVVLTIINQGHIPSEMVPVLFSPFGGGERAPGKPQGLGLGLYITRQIVLAHGGDIEIQPEDGIVRVEISLPRQTDHRTRSAVL
ncbi:MAG: response regulator [Pigmentiphaga sp.]